jgi:hypothetical protein
LEHVVASHYVDPETEDVKQFVEIMRSIDRHDGTAPKVTVMQPGETIVLEGD